MRPLSTVAWGLLLIVFDVRINELDLLPDPIGWAMAFFALWSLSRVHPAFGTASVAALAGGLVSIPDWFGATSDVFALVTLVAQTVLVFATCTGIMAASPRDRPLANQLRWWDLALTPVVLVILLPQETRADLTGPVLLVVIAQLAVFVLFMMLLFRASRAPLPAPVT